jgi:hypothetical protein
MGEPLALAKASAANLYKVLLLLVDLEVKNLEQLSQTNKKWERSYQVLVEHATRMLRALKPLLMEDQWSDFSTATTGLTILKISNDIEEALKCIPRELKDWETRDLAVEQEVFVQSKAHIQAYRLHIESELAKLDSKILAEEIVQELQQQYQEVVRFVMEECDRMNQMMETCTIYETLRTMGNMGLTLCTLHQLTIDISTLGLSRPSETRPPAPQLSVEKSLSV